MGTAVLDARTFTDHIREVTDEEVAFYRQNGWVELKSMMSAELAAEILRHVKELAGLDFDEWPDDPDLQQAFLDKASYQHRMRARQRDPWLRDFLANTKLGEAAARLTGKRPLRLFSETIFVQLPATSGLRSGTEWHQDFPAMPVDRAGAIQFWKALVPIDPEMGSMQHLSGSHREPPIGCPQFNGDQSAQDLVPELWERYELAPPHHFEPGDVLAHDIMTMHYAQPNQTNKLRWVLTSYRMPADTLYTGIPNHITADYVDELKVWQPFDHPNFPIVTED
jgi:ectoine hydroxylase-related dioxygenase (phytanoyl-CoA dioxygenase family)